MWKTCVMMMEELDVRRGSYYTEVKGLKLTLCPPPKAGGQSRTNYAYRTNALATSTALSKLTLVHHYHIKLEIHNTDSQPKYTEWKCIDHPPQAEASYIFYTLLESREVSLGLVRGLLSC